MYATIVGVVTAVALFHHFAVTRRKGLWNADGLFVISQWIMAVGTLLLLNEQDIRSDAYAVMISLPMVIYCFASWCVNCLAGTADSHAGGSRVDCKVPPMSARPPGMGMKLMIVLSISIAIWYYVNVGYNVFILGIEGMFTGTTYDVRTLRLDSYAGSRYLFPGYVNQFKNVILPSLSVVAIHYAFSERKGYRWILTALLAPMSLVGILGTGQRGAFIQFIVALLVFTYYANPRKFRRRALIAVVAMAPVLALATLILGRSSAALAPGSGIVNQASVLWNELARRIFVDNQQTGIAGFEYTRTAPIQWGTEWGGSLLDLLPGVTNPTQTLSSQVFRYLYGDSRGTAPPSMWGSVYYNFGWLGIVVGPMLLAVLYRKLTLFGLNRGSLDSLEAMGMAGVFAILGTWIAGGPDYLFNAGAATYAVLWWAGRNIPRRRTTTEPMVPPIPAVRPGRVRGEAPSWSKSASRPLMVEEPG